MDIYNPIATIELMKIEIDNLNKQLAEAQKDKAEMIEFYKKLLLILKEIFVENKIKAIDKLCVQALYFKKPKCME